MFLKLGEAIEISRVETMESSAALIDEAVLENFKKFAAGLKKVAPKAEDFLYFSAVIMHSAEAAALNDDGTIKLTIKGEPLKVGWNKSGNTWKWETNDSNIKPYKNSNGDIFPEEELVKAYRKWVGKPLCIDHKSSSVDHVRGFIVDTYYDRNLKRVIALCALDKHNYPDLARKVSTGYSSSVSMGTAVGRAICTDCGKVARVESDFCEHMRNKSCYGEINVDLNPIELSIVVNGADPKAHIKHIIAAANTLNSYVESKEKELNKIAEKYHASISMSTDNGSNHGNIDINSTSLDSFKEDVTKAILQLEQINNSLENPTNETASNQSSGTVAMDETVASDSTSLSFPHSRLASTQIDDSLVNELKEVTASIENKLTQMKQSLAKLASESHLKQEENMSGSNINKQGYFQGGGEGNEPSPGQPKYTKDPTNDKLRTDGDKHMETEDTGPVDGMHPGPASVGMSELERKKMLARATAEERAIRRNAIVNLAKEALEQKKQAYFQGGGDVNEPATNGKPKYPVDSMQDNLREKTDKQMVGQKPFPGVGSVDGMHPSPSSADTSDELKRKELLQRASLRARFVKAANNDGTQNLGKSAWEVFQGDKLLLTASVNDLTGNRSAILYDSIATKEFGAKLIEKVKAQGAEKVRLLVKSAQPMPEAAPPAMPEAAPPAPAMPEAAPAPEAMPEMPVEDTGKSGDKRENALELAEKIHELSSDLVEVEKTLSGEQAEMGKEDAGEALPEMAASASDVNLSTLNTLRKELSGALGHAIKEAVANLNEHEQELTMITNMYDKGAVNSSNEEFVGTVVEDAINEAKTAVADGFKLMTAFIKYARGTKAIVKRAEIEAELQSLAQAPDMTDVKPSFPKKLDESKSDDLQALIDETDADMAEISDALDVDEPEDEVLPVEDEALSLDEDLAADLTVKPEDLAKLPAGTKMTFAMLDTAAGRAQLRAKLAAEALKTSPHLHEAHPKSNVTTDLDVKPSGDLAVIENLEETHDAMMDLAKAPPKVRKEAEAIHKLISEGRLDPADLDGLVAEGLDKDAVAYYKKYFSQVDGGSEFASELVKEHAKAEMEAELNTHRVKLARAYELAYEMVDRGLVHNDRTSISAQVDEIMKYNDDSFDSLKRVVAKHSTVLRREAGHMPQVGMMDSSESHSEDNLVAQLSAALSKTTKKMF
jgi:hypothetical protein